MNRGLAADLTRIVGAGGVSTGGKDLSQVTGDALNTFRAFRAAEGMAVSPAVAVFPDSTRQVARVLKFANKHRIPVVPYGAGTGVMGAAAPVEGCIVLGLRRMDAVLDVSREDMTARVQAGVVLETAAKALEKAGLVLGHDPWSRPMATVGGAISTDSVGYTAAKHGSMGDQVLGLETVLADGEVVRTRAVPKRASGPDLDGLFVGTEGTLGVVTEATLRAFPKPEAWRLLPFTFPDFESGYRAVAALYSLGLRPTVVDYETELWPSDGEADETARLYLGFDGPDGVVEAEVARARSACLEMGARAGKQSEAAKFWRTRHGIALRYQRRLAKAADPAAARRGAGGFRMDYLHVALPASKVLEYRRRCGKILASHRVAVREWSLWARPEFLSFLIEDEIDAGGETSPALTEAVDQVLTLAQRMGGSMEYCHGVGLKLAHLAEGESDGGAAVAKRIKAALDPNNILNPGKLLG